MENATETLNDFQQLILTVAQGNVGVVNALIKIIEKDPIFINPLAIAMALTNSKSFGIWLVYKDMCKYDVEKTMETLRSWFDNSTIPLEKWLEARGIQ